MADSPAFHGPFSRLISTPFGTPDSFATVIDIIHLRRPMMDTMSIQTQRKPARASKRVRRKRPVAGNVIGRERPAPVGLERLFTIDQIAQLGGPCRAKLYDDIKAGRLKAIKFGRSTRIGESAYRQYIDSAPTLGSVGPSAARVRINGTDKPRKSSLTARHFRKDDAPDRAPAGRKIPVTSGSWDG
jgi:hypothetical protein